MVTMLNVSLAQDHYCTWRWEQQDKRQSLTFCVRMGFVQEEKANWLIYVTDEGQAGHFKLVFGAGKRAGIISADNPPRIDHVGFGLVLGQDGKRIRTRDSGAVCFPLCDCFFIHCTVPLAALTLKQYSGCSSTIDDAYNKRLGVMTADV